MPSGFVSPATSTSPVPSAPTIGSHLDAPPPPPEPPAPADPPEPDEVEDTELTEADLQCSFEGFFVQKSKMQPSYAAAAPRHSTSPQCGDVPRQSSNSSNSSSHADSAF